jgi:pimeloyl-ACP methyl ester carboxylesterase
MRQSPWWPAQETLAPTPIYDAELMGDYSIPREHIAAVTVPTLVIDGGTTPFLSQAAQEVAASLPNAQRRTLEGQPHNVDPAVLAPVFVEFFAH